MVAGLLRRTSPLFVLSSARPSVGAAAGEVGAGITGGVVIDKRIPRERRWNG